MTPPALAAESGATPDARPHDIRAAVLAYFFRHRVAVLQILLGMLASTGLSVAVPVLTQSVVDVGVAAGDTHIVALLLLAQLSVVLGRSVLDAVQSRLLVYVGTVVHVSVVDEFLRRLFTLPLAFFGARTVGDLMQRVSDHQRVQQFVTSGALSLTFALLNMIAFATVLGAYDLRILLIFAGGAVLTGFWTAAFARARRSIDNERFDLQSRNQQHWIQMLAGMPDLKLNGGGANRRGQWASLQMRLYQITRKSLRVNQLQGGGSIVLTQITTAFISYIVAASVIQGTMTIGMMIAISYITGGLGAPVGQILSFLQQAQDSKVSVQRIAEIMTAPPEQADADTRTTTAPAPANAPIVLDQVSFSYPSSARRAVDNVSVVFAPRQTTAIVGASGSGKSTLMKLLVRMLDPTAGTIRLGDTPLSGIDVNQWRAKCGVVLQDGYVFDDTIAANVVLSDDPIDEERVRRALEVAAIDDVVASLPQKMFTRLGPNGTGLSQGQRQRLLIARAVYKNPPYLLMDEATAFLDAATEETVTRNITEFAASRTVIVIAHRLRTVQSADEILVMREGRIAERGTPAELLQRDAEFARMIRHQLEI